MWNPGGVELRRLRSLLFGLPPGAAIYRDVAGTPPDQPPWGYTEELLAVIAELVHENIRVLVKANSKKGTRLPDPLRLPRPWTPPRRPATAHDLKLLFGGRVVYTPRGE
ncbi:MAG: hypothetical protein P1T08_12760 [Acidimicrobiia bacterium]|nr:hypothetical protein [Acidimicrobiia bacterium]